ncbi:MAG TPA: CCE_0567 family metalloprotein [Campylobacterales bacterium]|nr:CCE_0567 family metalloprotein [Campylobacterales bacterium]
MEDPKKELATMKRKASEIASKIHDIVEDTLWTEYNELKPLSEQIIKAIDEYYEFKKANNL